MVPIARELPDRRGTEMDVIISRNTLAPPYYQIEQYIREKIGSGEWPPGTQLPSERELRAKLGASRSTIRKAIRGLITEGYCTKRAGRGVFVSNPKIPMSLNTLEGTSRFARTLGFDVKTRVIHKEVVGVCNPVAAKLRVPEGEKLLFVKRVRYIAGEPLLLESTYLPLRVFPGIDSEDFSGSLYDIMREKYNVKAHRAECILNVKLAQEEETRLLDVQLSTAILVKETIAYNEHNVPIEFTISTYRSDRFTFLVTSTSRDGNEGDGK